MYATGCSRIEISEEEEKGEAKELDGKIKLGYLKPL